MKFNKRICIFHTHAATHILKPNTSGMQKHVSLHNLEREKKKKSLMQTFLNYSNRGTKPDSFSSHTLSA